MKILQRASPNFNARPCPVDAIILHATADEDTQGSVEWCCTPKSKNPNPVSYHVIVDRDGTVYHLVDTAKRAWHAGVSSFLGRGNCNDYTIGLSFANKNDGHEPYTDEQLSVGAALCAAWIARYPAIRDSAGPLRITTHALVALPAGRKTDPAPPAFSLPEFLTRVWKELEPS